MGILSDRHSPATALSLAPPRAGLSPFRLSGYTPASGVGGPAKRLRRMSPSGYDRTSSGPLINVRLYEALAVKVVLICVA